MIQRARNRSHGGREGRRQAQIPLLPNEQCTNKIAETDQDGNGRRTK